jgi:hypothetical protein
MLAARMSSPAPKVLFLSDADFSFCSGLDATDILPDVCEREHRKIIQIPELS